LLQILDNDDEEEDLDDTEAADAAVSRDKCAVVKTTTRNTVFLPIIGLVRAEDLRPGDLVGVNKDSFIVLEKLPTEHDSRVKAMELDEKPTEDYTDIGGLDQQIQELIEAVVLPMTQADRFKKLGVSPPKGVLMHGPPGTGKTLLARACAKNTDAVFLKLAGPQLVQQYIGDGAKMVRDAFDLAKEKSKERGGAIIFIDEIDAIGTKRHDSGATGDREVQRTMLELLNQLDGFDSNTTIKVIAATNRPDILDPALLRSVSCLPRSCKLACCALLLSAAPCECACVRVRVYVVMLVVLSRSSVSQGRLDRKIELPHPNEKARAQIMRIHSKKMRYDKEEVNFDELARSTDDFNGAMMKAICVEAGMIALRRGADIIQHEDFVDGIGAVQMKKKKSLQYYA
jgi:26S proteasome regulatory subunit T5